MEPRRAGDVAPDTPAAVAAGIRLGLEFDRAPPGLVQRQLVGELVHELAERSLQVGRLKFDEKHFFYDFFGFGA